MTMAESVSVGGVRLAYEAAFDSGARAYRCVAHLLRTRNPRTSQFGP